MESSTVLDGNELMHLALHATQHGTPDKAIGHLKRLLKIQPENGKAHYLLGALHAEIGMYDQAAEEMALALKLEPSLTTARFQLGLLHITSGRVSEAESVWSALDVLGDQDPLYLFKKGMLHLVKDEFEQCVTALGAGIALNGFNEDLNNDMRKVLQDAVQAIDKSPSVSNEQNESGDAVVGQRMLLSLYESQDN